MAGFRPQRPHRRSPEEGCDRGERGFVLIAAIWLLILAGSIAAVLMLRSLASATAAADHEGAFERRLALESAIETLLADRLFNGQGSAWWRVPASGSITIDGRDVMLRLTSETGRLDVNTANPALIDTALQGFGVAAVERERVAVRLQALRTMKRRIGSPAEVDRLIADAQARAQTCLAEHFTFVSGQAEPGANFVSAELRRAMGGHGGATASGATVDPENGAALRIEAGDGAGARILAIVRTPGLAEQPVQVSAWSTVHPCRPARSH